ncbi:DUF4097 family beta strand repeat-containing protein [Amycolatopsis rifamycinica]|uniref:Adhesin domain-containing protein n=1 Tax=Amycolatopsis rifamycinica TaxID=287986 RepID=A0A066U554_9PSEU|nr:hypothetical protein [Amycolatopsis rifamycinica]KDN19239.1 hypothetical protein DV20_26665 [Amycolatopsis rifamycinica]
MNTFVTPEPITATLTTAGARVRVAASERTDTVVRVEPVDHASQADVKVAERTEVGFTDGTLSVKTTKSGAKTGSVAITIELPAGSGLVVHTAWTDVHAEGPLGDCELNLASGRVRLGRVAALRAGLAAGDVEIGHVAGSAVVEGGAAGLRIGEIEGVFRYEGSTGPVRIGHARSDVEFGSASGRFDVERADGDVVAKAGNCPLRIGRVTGGRVELTNAAGGIDIGVGEGVAAAVDAESTKGAVRNTLPDTPGAAVKIHARTRLGDIVVHPAA